MGTHPPDPDIMALHSRTQDHVDDYGWSVVAVGGDDHTPPYAYTVGLTEKNRPELLICGLPIGTMQSLLNGLGARAAYRPLPYGHGAAVADLLGGGLTAILIDGTENPDMRLGMANTRYGRVRVRVQQLIWPDINGRYPWQVDYAHTGARQPLLYGVDTGALA